MATPQDPIAREGGSRAPASDEQDPQSPPAPAAPRPKSPYAMSKGDASMRNIGWALGLTMACVAIAGVIFFGVGRGVDREVPETSRLDVGASAQRAQEQASFPVALPTVPKDWTPRSAEYTEQDTPTWSVGYTAPSNSLVTVVESEEVTPAQLSAALPGARPDGTVSIQGVDCETLTGDDEGQRGISCQGDGWGIIAHGSADQDEITQLAKAAVTSIEDGGAGTR